MNFTLSRWFRPTVPTCIVCGRDADTRRRPAPLPVRHPAVRAVLRKLCYVCSEAIPWIVSPVCRVCGRPEVCPDCPRREVRHLLFSRGAVRYDDRMKDWLALYKYRGSEALEPLMAAMMSYGYERIIGELPSIHAVTSVPLARERLEERGFNQAERMARTLAEWYGVPYYALLQRNRHTEKQSLKNRRSRLVDMKGNFVALDPRKLSALADRHGHPVRIVLVDDIYTTGSTMNECAGALEAALPGYAEVYGLMWARS